MIEPTWLPIVVGGAIAAFITPVIAAWATTRGVVDKASSAPDRKRQKHPVPLLGGVVLFVTFAIGLLIFQEQLFGGYLFPKHVIGLVAAIALLAVGGALDDMYNLSAKKQIAFPILAALIMVASGIGISYIDNPLGPDIDLAAWGITIFEHGGVPYQFLIFADLFTIAWLLVMTYTTKLLDGIDGLVSGLGVSGSLILFFISLKPDVMQPETAILAGLFGGACLGFLLWNWHPARMYLGEGGSTMIGFVLGTLAIISGAKIATTLLIVGLPLIDHSFVVARRSLSGLNPFKTPDRSHIHQRLVDAGIPVKWAASLLISISTIFGLLSIYLPRHLKSYVLIFGALIATVIGVWLIRREWRNRSKSDTMTQLS